MTIAIETSGLKTGYRTQGTGVYIASLLTNLKRYTPKNEYINFSRTTNIPRNVNLVHYPYFNPFFLTLPLRKPLPTVVTVHDLIPFVFPEHFPVGIRGRLKWYIQKWSLKGASAIIADSDSSKQDIVRFTGINREKIHVVHLAPGEEFEKLEVRSAKLEVRQKYNLPEKFVLYVGDIIWSKNILNLIKAIKTVNITLVIVGKQAVSMQFDRNHPWNKDLVILNREAEGDKRIVRLGFVPNEDLVVIYNLATLFVMPSFYEGFGLPVLEAMSCGCPVVTTKRGSLPEVAENAAYYVDPDDVSSIADGIGEVFFTTKLQKNLSQKGLTQSKKFSWEKTAKETVKLYEKVMGSK